MAQELTTEIQRRRTFAIISHPDAGKTTLTEKLLLYGGAIHLAGAVRAKANQRHTTSDWMEIEKQRGISISSTVLQFEYQGSQINLLDTPGHKDFSEDTYRTLMAADAAVMLIDAAKGVEPQTRKLFEVCRMRGLPIFTFFNKLDRPSREPLELIDELEKVLGIRSCPITWPIGAGDRFRGVYDRQDGQVLVYQTEGEANVKGRLAPVKLSGLQDPKLENILAGPRKDTDEAKELRSQLESELELLEFAGDPFDWKRVLAGELTPAFFGSAMNNFGVQQFLEKFIAIAPPPSPRRSNQGEIAPSDPKFSGFIFKIQANMDPNHRDRVAFMRICSGKFERNMQVKNTRAEKDVKLSMPLNFFGQERVVIEQAFPGDVVGLVDTSGSLRISDTLTQKTGLLYPDMPTFTPEHFASVILRDPLKRKQLKKGLDQLSEEGVVQIYKQKDGSEQNQVLAAVGGLQFEVLQHRLLAEYGVEVKIERLPYVHARWVEGDATGASFLDSQSDTLALLDRDGHWVLLFKSDWALRWTEENHAKLNFLKTAPGRKN